MRSSNPSGLMAWARPTSLPSWSTLSSSTRKGRGSSREDAWTEPITEEALKQPGAVAFLVFDSKLRARDEVSNTVGAAIPEEKVIEAASIPELAEKLGIDPDALQATIDEYNTACETGEDPLGKGKKALFPCKEAPFYGIIADPCR